MANDDEIVDILCGCYILESDWIESGDPRYASDDSFRQFVVDSLPTDIVDNAAIFDNPHICEWLIGRVDFVHLSDSNGRQTAVAINIDACDCVKAY